MKSIGLGKKFPAFLYKTHLHYSKKKSGILQTKTKTYTYLISVYIYWFGISKILLNQLPALLNLLVLIEEFDLKL